MNNVGNVLFISVFIRIKVIVRFIVVERVFILKIYSVILEIIGVVKFKFVNKVLLLNFSFVFYK